MSDKIILIDTNILFNILNRFRNRESLSKYELSKIIKTDKLFKNNVGRIKIPDVVINEFYANFFNTMNILGSRKKFLKENDYRVWMNLQYSAWSQIVAFVMTNKVGSVKFDSFKFYGYNLFALATSITEYEIPKKLIDELSTISAKDDYANVKSGKLFDGMDSIILSYIFIYSLENSGKKVEFVTGDNYFKLGGNYFIKNKLPVMKNFKYPTNLKIRGL